MQRRRHAGNCRLAGGDVGREIFRRGAGARNQTSRRGRSSFTSWSRSSATPRPAPDRPSPPERIRPHGSVNEVLMRKPRREIGPCQHVRRPRGGLPRHPKESRGCSAYLPRLKGKRRAMRDRGKKRRIRRRSPIARNVSRERSTPAFGHLPKCRLAIPDGTANESHVRVRFRIAREQSISCPTLFSS